LLAVREGPGPAGSIATTPIARGEFALILLVLAVMGPIMAGRAHWLALALQTTEGMLSARRAANAPRPVRRPDQAALDPERQPVSGRV
jgi:monovalent cation:H+ antiporter-2, CPA2 family